METYVIYYTECSEEYGCRYNFIEMQSTSLNKCYTLAKRLFGSRVAGVVLKKFDIEFIKGNL